MAKKDETTVNKPAFTPKVIKQVTMPSLKLVVDQPAYVKVTAAIYEGKTRENDKGDDGKQKAPPKILNVINLETGEANTLVCGVVVVSEITENYEGDSYVGKCFMIKKLGKKEGRDYFTYAISEIEDPTK